MSYIVRVVGYNAFFTNDDTPGKLWSTNVGDAFKFDSLEEATKVVESGQNMEAVDYADGLDLVGIAPPDWDAIDRAEEELKKRKEESEATPADVEVV